MVAKPLRHLGPYRLSARIGRGGMAEVYRARVYGASGFEKAIAIKVLRPEYRGHGRMERMLIEEARLGARLDHPNLVGVHDLGLDNGIYYIRMDLVDGADLRTLQSEERLPVPLALHVAHQVACALEHIHSARDAQGRPMGLVHRDLSPSNVLLSRTGDVKLSDLGIAKPTLESDRTWGEVLKGKYAYMSPEQLLDQPLSAVSDHFSLATLMYEALTGTRPFDAETTFATMDRVRRAELPPLSGLSRGLRRLLERCFKREPHERLESTRALVVSLDDLTREPYHVLRERLAAWVARPQG